MKPHRFIPFSIVLVSLLLIHSGSIQPLHAQQNDIYSDMSLEELLKINVVTTASKKPEDLFEAPLSVSIITRDDIINSGATSIPEALRLAQGMIVREQTPGNYDVHIRGFDEATRNFMFPLPNNSITLVMIDYRVVYDYFSGGTFWEALPIDWCDIERIEVVRGPAAAIYGPNACAGVINIITNHNQQPGLNLTTHAMAGNQNYIELNHKMNYNWSNHTQLTLSGNYKNLDRIETQYYDWFQKRYADYDDLQSMMILGFDETSNHPVTVKESYLDAEYDQNHAQQKMGLNLFFNHQFSLESALDLSAGYQKSYSQRFFYNNFVTPLSEYDCHSGYIDLKAKHKNLNTQLSLNNGQHNNNYYWNRYKYTIANMLVEYDRHFPKLDLRSGFNIQQINYHSVLLSDGFGLDFESDRQIPNNSKSIRSMAGIFYADYRPVLSLRLISAFRIEHYDLNDKLSIMAQLGAIFRDSKDNVARIVLSKADRAPFMLDSYINQSVNVPIWMEKGHDHYEPANIKFSSNTNIDYLSNYTGEIGWRTKIIKNVFADFELFKSFLLNNVDLAILNINRDTTTYPIPMMIYEIKYRNNNSYYSSLEGFGFNLEYSPNSRLTLRFHGMVQHSAQHFDRDKLKEHYLTNFRYEGKPVDSTHIDSLIMEEITNVPVSTTPEYVGGLWIHYAFRPNLHFNTNAYYIQKQVLEGIVFDQKITQTIPSSMQINMKLSYRWNDAITLYGSLRNLIGKHREYAFTDNIYRSWYFGIQITY
ncbi:MAG: TonB-dependent receptor plug domain-containing protein [Candidatus Delongbacteria bacterium]|nr:TonB-dependent receptor plug domain-containing protein [Candidatus Delongbacteria bacterium]